MRPYAAEGVYVNYLDDDEKNRVRTAYGERYERLVDLKNEWDPENLFRMNQKWDLTTFEDLSTPTLLPVGSESGWLKDKAEELHDTLPNSRLVTFEGHGHAAHLVTPDRYTDKVLSFISELD